MYLNPLHNTLVSSQVGGKAAGLSTLIAFGVAVPKGFAIDKELLNLYSKTSSLPGAFELDLKRALTELDCAMVIVRSSAIGEDSDSHSFAGQLDSFVVENNFESVKAAIIKCWGSLHNDRVAAYQSVSGKVLSEMGVVIQEYLEADYAGVTFTASPHNPEFIYSEYVKGAGEQLVSGKVTPQNFSVKFKESMDKKLPFNSVELLEKSSHLKEKYGHHLDIEWVAKGDNIYFVQARPITVKSSVKVHWSNTNLNENYPDPISPLLYSIARDSYYHYFKNLAGLLQIDQGTIRKLEYDFSNTVGIWGNRLYYNMTSIHNILTSSPLKNYFKDAFNKFVGYADKDVANADTSKKTSLFRLIKRLVGLNLKLESHVKQIEKMVSDFASRAGKAEEIEDYKELFYEFLDLRFNQWYHASLADFFSMIHYKSLGKITQKFYGAESVGVHNQLIQAIPGLISSQPLNETYDMALLIREDEEALNLFLDNTPEDVYQEITEYEKWERIHTAVQKYLDKWGFRCSGELMFFKKNYIEDPAKLIELLQSYLRQAAQDPVAAIAVKAEERKQAMRTFAWKIVKKRHVLFPLSFFEVGQLYLTAHLCKQAISSRERVRYKQAEMYYRFNVVVNSIGKDAVEKGIVSDASDLLYLTYKEIGEMISSSNMFFNDTIELVSQRKSTFAKESEKIFPEHFATVFGERPEMVNEEVFFKEGADEISGLAASGGRIKARIKVLESVLESEKLNKGDILVTRQTDPGWAMVFPLIGGLIVERGGALSHGAIVAREFGIPAVIGIPNIAEILKDDDEVILDGDLGKIQIL